MSKVKIMLQIFAVVILVLHASAGEKMISTELNSLISKYEGHPVEPINEKVLFYSNPEKKSGWDIESAVIEDLPIVGTAHCLGGSRKTTPISLFASPSISKQLHTIACSNINDWLASEKDGTPIDSFDRGIIILREENEFVQVALASSLYKTEFTRKKMMSDFPALGSWENIYTAWLKKDALSPIEKSTNSAAKASLKKLILSPYDFDNIKSASMVVKKVQKIKSEFWLEIQISVLSTGFKKNAYAPLFKSDGNPQFKIAVDGSH